MNGVRPPPHALEPERGRGLRQGVKGGGVGGWGVNATWLRLTLFAEFLFRARQTALLVPADEEEEEEEEKEEEERRRRRFTGGERRGWGWGFTS